MLSWKEDIGSGYFECCGQGFHGAGLLRHVLWMLSDVGICAFNSPQVIPEDSGWKRCLVGASLVSKKFKMGGMFQGKNHIKFHYSGFPFR